VRLEVARDITEERYWQDHAAQKQELVGAIGRVQRAFHHQHGPPAACLIELLDTVLRLTRSEYGFMGNCGAARLARPRCGCAPLSNIAWDRRGAGAL